MEAGCLLNVPLGDVTIVNNHWEHGTEVAKNKVNRTLVGPEWAQTGLLLKRKVNRISSHESRGSRFRALAEVESNMETATFEQENEARENTIPMIEEEPISTRIRAEEPRGQNNSQLGSGARETRARTFQGNSRNLEANFSAAARLANRPTVEVTRDDEVEQAHAGPKILSDKSSSNG